MNSLKYTLLLVELGKKPSICQFSRFRQFAVVHLNFISCKQPAADYQYLKAPEATIKWFVGNIESNWVCESGCAEILPTFP